MICPHCKAENEATADSCFTCGHVFATATAIKRGSLVAGRYEILSPLGKGGMGMVYKAHDRVLDETVALKVLRPDVAREADMARRFRSEIKLARKVRHRNVCGIHEYGEQGELRYIAMEFIEGVDFRHLLQDRGAPLPEEAFEISIQVAEGLAAIHDAGIIHRDLKTPNIMRDSRGYVRLMDFGIAKQAGAEATLGATAVGMIVGTPEYMSPEQARGEKIDYRSDIYALGIVVFEVFTGHVPFRGDTPIATIFKHLQDSPPLEGPRAAALPESLIPILKKSLSKQAADRYNTVHDMVEALREARSITFPKSRSGPVTAGLRPQGGRPEPVPFATHGTPMPAASPLSTAALPTPVPTNVPTAVRTHVSPPPPATEFVQTPVPLPPAPPPPEAEEDRERARQDRERQERARQEAERQEPERRAKEEHDRQERERQAAEERRRAEEERARQEAERKERERQAAEERRAEEERARQEAERKERERKAAEERRRAEEQRAAAVRKALQEAERHLEKGRAEAGQAAVDRALGLDPSDRAARSLAARVADLSRRQEEERQRDAEVSRLVAEAERLFGRQQLDEAQRAAEQALGLDPGHKPAQKVAARIGDAARRKSEEERRVQAAAARAVAEAPTAEVERPSRAAAPAARAVEAVRPQPVATLPAAGPPVAKIAAGVAVLGVALLAVGLWLARGRSDVADLPSGPAASPSAVADADPATAPDIRPSAGPTAAPAAPAGLLVVDALPWGEVTEVVDASGKRQPLGPSPFTPLVLSLTPGRYTVSLKNPDYPRGLSVTATVSANGLERRVAEFGKVDAAEYFERAGW